MRLLLALDALDPAPVARGLVAAGLPEPDVHDPADGLDVAFDARMRAAFALVVGEPVLDRGTLGGRVTGELATRARQAGVPCHAIVGADRLDPFGKRILDLQHVLVAADAGALEAAGTELGRRLAADVRPG
ncbi:MAG: glycerate kinase [Solirubrobacteraceae bacterium]|nr:glycerate kinase [Solirubrobacteraceae bacterium]